MPLFGSIDNPNGVPESSMTPISFYTLVVTVHQERHLEGSLVDQYACITVTAALLAGATGIFQMYFR